MSSRLAKLIDFHVAEVDKRFSPRAPALSSIEGFENALESRVRPIRAAIGPPPTPLQQAVRKAADQLAPELEAAGAVAIVARLQRLAGVVAGDDRELGRQLWHRVKRSLLCLADRLERRQASDRSARPAGSMPSRRPDTPTRAYCLRPPNIVRWSCETRLGLRLWHLLGAILDAAGKPLRFDRAAAAIDHAQPPSDKTIRNYVSDLNKQLLDYPDWPLTFSTMAGAIITEKKKLGKGS